jgi:hypothetical protein
MSERNGDRARFQKNRKRTIHHRQRIRAFLSGLWARSSARGARRAGTGTATDTTSAEARLAMLDDGGPMRAGD